MNPDDKAAALVRFARGVDEGRGVRARVTEAVRDGTSKVLGQMADALSGIRDLLADRSSSGPVDRSDATPVSWGEFDHVHRLPRRSVLPLKECAPGGCRFELVHGQPVCQDCEREPGTICVVVMRETVLAGGARWTAQFDAKWHQWGWAVELLVRTPDEPSRLESLHVRDVQCNGTSYMVTPVNAWRYREGLELPEFKMSTWTPAQVELDNRSGGSVRVEVELVVKVVDERG